MITIRLVGGLGNQMFCYAAARALSFQKQTELAIDIHSGFREDVFKREYSLGRLNISILPKNIKRCFMFPSGRLIQGLSRRLNRFLPIALKWYWYETERRYVNDLIDLPQSVYLDGYFQSPLYFRSLKDILKTEFSLINEPLDDQNLLLSKLIKSRFNSVCVHVRKLRMFSSDGTQVLQIDDQELEREYYEKAIRYIDKKLTDPFYVFFGDDPKWLHESFRERFSNSICVDFNKGDGQSHFDFWLMRQCKNFIISNSTFAWWAAWLALDDTGIRIAPNLGYWANKDILADGYFTLLD